MELGQSYGGAYLLRRGMYMPWELPELMDSEMVEIGWNELNALNALEQTVKGIQNAHHQVSALEMMWYMKNQLLRDTDWAGMAHSVEIRVPLVDVQLLRNIAPLLGNSVSPNKSDMALTPIPQLPEVIRMRRKTGFSVPVREWIFNEIGKGVEKGLRSWAKKLYFSANN
jgi:asparagine synthase (glutamine-hydrolysing)